MKFEDYLMLNKSPNETEKETFSLIGEPDGKGNIKFIRHYRNDEKWKSKSKPLVIPASEYWATAEAVKNGTYKPKKIKKSRIPQLALMPTPKKKEYKTKTKK